MEQNFSSQITKIWIPRNKSLWVPEQITSARGPWNKTNKVTRNKILDKEQIEYKCGTVL
jgi:hypothetical protein